jgi:hypothetical protein
MLEHHQVLFVTNNIGTLGQLFCYLSIFYFFIPHFVVSAWRLKCTKHLGTISVVW